MNGSRAFLRELKDPSTDISLAGPQSGALLAEEAYERGIVDGLERGRIEIEAQMSSAVTALVERLDDSGTLRETLMRHAAEEAGAALVKVLHLLCPGLAALGLADRAVHLLESELRDVPRPVMIRAAPDVAARLVARIAERAGEGLQVVDDETLSGSRIDLDWQEGRATFDAEALVQQVFAHAAILDAPTDNAEDQTR